MGVHSISFYDANLVHVCACEATIVGVNSPSPMWVQKMNSGHQTWYQGPLPRQLSYYLARLKYENSKKEGLMGNGFL